jgi:hypothetical protein
MISVPKNKIAIIPSIEDDGIKKFDEKDVHSFLKSLKNEKKRDWFSSNFYKCLPLSIGNRQGFVVSVPFNFDVFWNGGDRKEDLYFNFYEDEKKYRDRLHIGISSHFGHGIMTINLPVIIKTPKGINIMTIAPPNFPLPGMSPMVGVVETDNLRYTFTLNIKIDIAQTWIKVSKDYPLVGLLPIPRYFCDSFDLEYGSEIIDKNDFEEERTVAKYHDRVKFFLANSNEKDKYDRSYFNGKDIVGNKYSDHQI